MQSARYTAAKPMSAEEGWSLKRIEYDLTKATRCTIASGLPTGAPPGVVPKELRAVGTLSGPMGPFAAIAAAADGTLYVSADAEGSVLTIRPAQ